MKILLLNCSWNNRGDESAIRAMIDELKSIYPDIKFEILNHEELMQFPYTSDEVKITQTGFFTKKNLLEVPLLLLSRGRLALFSNSKTLINSIKNSDLILHAPGGPSMGDIYKTVQYASYYKFLVAKMRHKPYIFYAPSMGPFNSKFENRLRRIIFNNAAVIATREIVSAEYLEELHIKKEVHVTMDSALQHNFDEKKYEQQLNEYVELKEFLNKYKKVIGITFTGLKWNSKYKDRPEIQKNIESTFKTVIDYLNENGYGVVFIPQLFGKHHDFKRMQDFAVDNCFLADDEHDCYFQQHLIEKLHIVIGMRYHSNIFSAKMKTPFISVSYEQKMEGFSKMIHMDDYCIDVNNLTPELLISKFEMLEENYDAVKQHLEHINNDIKKKSFETTQLVCDYIDNNLR